MEFWQSTLENVGIVETIIEAMGSDLKPVILDGVTNEIEHQCLSEKKVKEVLDWEPRYILKEGLRRTMEWYRKFFFKEEDKR